MRKFKLGQESATPKAERVMILLRPGWAFRTLMALALALASRWGGEAVADQGLSLVRGALRVTIMAKGAEFGGVVAAAFSMSVFERGVPVGIGLDGEGAGLLLGHLLPCTILRPSRVSSDSGFRTKAVTVCPLFLC